MLLKKLNDHITICICTYRRNRMLANLLQKLAAQETCGLFTYSIIVVDNDEKKSAKQTIKLFREKFDLDIQYDVVIENLIPRARNRAIEMSEGNYIAIIDDDEIPPWNWLLTMLRTMQTFDVDGALGPVHPFFQAQPPAWLMKGRFCERPVLRTGTLLTWDQTRTGNCFIKKEVFIERNFLFDERFKTGGSDQDFFKRAMKAGCRFIAVEEAPVFEIVPPERWKKSYYLKRALVNGFNAHQYCKNQTSLKRKIMGPAKAVMALITYLLAMPFLVFLGTHVAMKYLEKGTHHFSRLCALMGFEIMKKRSF